MSATDAGDTGGLVIIRIDDIRPAALGGLDEVAKHVYRTAVEGMQAAESQTATESTADSCDDVLGEDRHGLLALVGEHVSSPLESVRMSRQASISYVVLAGGFTMPGILANRNVVLRARGSADAHIPCRRVLHGSPLDPRSGPVGPGGSPAGLRVMRSSEGCGPGADRVPRPPWPGTVPTPSQPARAVGSPSSE